MKKKKYLEIDYFDYNLVLSALLNKGSAFTEKERDDFNLHGLIPPQIGSMQQQLNRSYKAFSNKHSNIEKYIYLRDLQDSNETLFLAALTKRSINSSYLLPRILLCFQPRYKGSFKRSSLSVPASSKTGSVDLGWIPEQAV